MKFVFANPQTIPPELDSFVPDFSSDVSGVTLEIKEPKPPRKLKVLPSAFFIVLIVRL
jgi:hypothetical protein